jgi:hypothetical protein
MSYKSGWADNETNFHYLTESAINWGRVLADGNCLTQREGATQKLVEDV